jgi:hypothetical protein
MIKQIKVVILLSACMMCNAVFAAQSDLTDGHLESLQEAYKYVLSKEYDIAKDLYQKIQTTDGAESGLMRAAAEGEGLALLLDLNERVLNAKGDDIKLRLLRNRRRTTVRYLEKAAKKYQDETLIYMLSIAKEEGEISGEIFANLQFPKEYSRLLATPAVAPTEPVVDKSKPTEKPEDKVTVVSETVLRNVTYRAISAVKVRSGPGTNTPEVATLANNQEVIVVKSIRLSNNQVWLKLKKGKKIGYVSANYLTKGSKVSKNTTGAKTIKIPPAKGPTAKATPPKKTPVKATQKPVKSTGSNKACAEGSVIWHLAKEDVTVFESPGGKRKLTYKKNNKIPVVRIQPSYLIVRVGQSCGYIFRDDKKLKRLTR